MKTGFILIDKPAGWTSHDVVAHLRRVTGERKIGHAGTLDPFATGLLILGIGRPATRQLGEFLKMDKKYEAIARLGARSDTHDKTGAITKKKISKKPSLAAVKKALLKFRGEQEQIPPMFSAKKIHGQKLYNLARAGKEIAREPNKIIIHQIRLKKYAWPALAFSVSCSSGTYIRSLAHDLGTALGTGAYLTALRRTEIGRIPVLRAVNLEKINRENWEKYLKNRLPLAKLRNVC
ncbi:MAG: tRNA pseudouridine(55) synthase TruB [Patescibacteria group bacterium]|nr:tRNA pseudouridine(55) synthase TruB [Patescibacteria group bacterium]